MREIVKKAAIILPGALPVPCVFGGAIESTIQLIVEQNEIHQKLNLTVFSPYNKDAKRLSSSFKHTQFVWIRKGMTFHFLNFFIRGFRKAIFKNLDYLDGKILKWHIRRGEFDKVIIHGNTSHLLALAKVIPKEKLIFYIHANLFERPTPQSLSVGKSAERYVTVSEFVKQKVVGNAGTHPDQVIVIKNPIDFARFSAVYGSSRPCELVEKYDIRPNDIVILFAGRIVENKGIMKLIQALKSLPEETNFKLLVVGSFGSAFGRGQQKDGFHDKLINLAATMKGKIIFTGFVHNSELPKYHALADVVVMPSLCEEAAGKVAMEAMASGRAVITTRAGGIPEYVAENCGIILERGERFVSDLAIAILELAQNKEKRRKMGTEGAVEARRFSPEIYYGNYVKLISSVT